MLNKYFNLYMQLATHLGGVRTRYRSAAVDASSGFAGFPHFLQPIAKACSQRVFSDQVWAWDLPQQLVILRGNVCIPGCESPMMTISMLQFQMSLL